MGNRADRNEVDAGRGDLANVLECDAAARFKFHSVFANRDRFPDLRGLHVVEENDVDAVDSQKSMDLIESVSFHFNLNVGMGVAKFAYGLSQLIETANGGEMIIFDQD